MNRREFLGLCGIAGAVAIAGCTSRGESSGESPGTLDLEPAYGGWFEGVSNYDGTLDYRGEDSVTVEVGAQGSLGYYKFAPPAVAVVPGTTVEWRWTGKGGGHDVRADNGAFHSGELVSAKGHTFTHTFEAPGVYKYYCTPHRGMGMKGAVFVALDE